MMRVASTYVEQEYQVVYIAGSHIEKSNLYLYRISTAVTQHRTRAAGSRIKEEKKVVTNKKKSMCLRRTRVSSMYSHGIRAAKNESSRRLHRIRVACN